jgi:hypothetical protein
MKKLLLGILSVAAGFVFTGCVATTQPGYGYYGYQDYPATYYAAPAPGMVWIEGDWYIDGGHWHQHGGRWEHPPYAGANYHHGYWNGSHEWHHGEWH